MGRMQQSPHFFSLRQPLLKGFTLKSGVFAVSLSYNNKVGKNTKKTDKYS